MVALKLHYFNTHPCHYGIDTPDKHELIASSNTVEQIKEFIGVDSLAYLSREGLYRAVGSEPGKFCDACFSGEYPAGTPVQITPKKQQTLF